MEKNVNAPENLRVKVSKFKSPLSFNEWAKQYRVSSQYTEYQPLFQGNPSAGINPQISRPTFWQELRRLLLIRD
jgi:hypothetical protein